MRHRCLLCTGKTVWYSDIRRRGVACSFTKCRRSTDLSTTSTAQRRMSPCHERRSRGCKLSERMHASVLERLRLLFNNTRPFFFYVMNTGKLFTHTYLYYSAARKVTNSEIMHKASANSARYFRHFCVLFWTFNNTIKIGTNSHIC